MPTTFLRRGRRRISTGRRKPKFMWIRDTVHNVGPIAVNANDLMIAWRNDMSLSANFNLPDFTVYRVIAQLSLSYHLSAASYSSDTGCWVGVFADSSLQTQTASLFTGTGQYIQKYMLWDKLMHSEGQMNTPFAAVTTASVYTAYKRWDIKTRRKLGETDSVFLVTQPAGNMILDQYDINWNLLLRVPG